jgi:hypothetical protein
MARELKAALLLLELDKLEDHVRMELKHEVRATLLLLELDKEEDVGAKLLLLEFDEEEDDIKATRARQGQCQGEAQARHQGGA